MRLRVFFVAVAAAFLSLAAHAGIQTLERAVETSSKFLSMPTTANGRVLLRSCEECELHSPRLAPYTEYVLGGERLSFAQFRQAYYSLKGRGERFVLVAYDVKNNTVTRVAVSTPAD